MLEGFSETQANEFLRNWRVVDHQPNTFTGFSATLFETLDENAQGTGKYSLAIRGTDQIFGFDLVEDIFGIALQGVASRQAVDLYRYYKKLTTTEGQAVEYSQQELLVLTGLISGEFDALAIVNAIPNYLNILVLTQGDKGLGRLSPDMQIDVTGHSLGGHLSMLFSRMFPDAINSIHTYNGAGLGGITKEVLDLAGYDVDIPNDKIKNIIADQGLDISAGLGFIIGEPERVFIEESSSLDNHKIEKLVDALSVYNLLNDLFPHLSRKQITPILEAGASDVSGDLEGIVNAVGDLLGLGTPIATDDREQFYQRLQEISVGIYIDPNVPTPVLKPEYQGLALVDLSSQDVNAIEANARQNIAYRYALEKLVPFAIFGEKSTAIYAVHNRNGELQRYDPGTGQGMTDEYIRDRTALLHDFLIRSTANSPGFIGDVNEGPYAGQFVHFIDNETGYETRRFNNVPEDLEITLHFGKDDNSAESLIGSKGQDHLYGRKGLDVLIGDEGADQLQGGLGDDFLFATNALSQDDDIDKLQGGFGHDTYFAGHQDVIEDADGRGDVLLFNGTSYVALTGGTHQVGDPNNVYKSADGRITYTLNGTVLNVTTNGNTLTINDFNSGVIKATGDYHLGIRLNNSPAVSVGTPLVFDVNLNNIPRFINGLSQEEYRAAFGIYAGDGLNGWWSPTGAGTDKQPDEIHVTGSTDLGFFINPVRGGPGDSQIFGNDSDNYLVDYSQFGENLDGSPRTLLEIGNGDSDRLEGNGGDDFLLSGYGNDFLYGGDGDDWLIGSASWQTEVFDWVRESPDHQSRDQLYGEAGNDVLISHADDNFLDGGEGVDVLFAGADDDTLHGGGGNDVLAGDIYINANPIESIDNGGSISFSAVVDHKLVDDAVSYGNDKLFGDAGNDILSGGGGDDLLDGGVGDDILRGDRFTEQVNGLTIPEIPESVHGNDALFGGEGQDQLYGEGGDDRLFGGTGDDLIGGGEDNDVLYGDAGDDRLFGDSTQDESGSGDDLLFGGDGNDQLVGGGGNDVLSGGSGVDVIIGGTGNDVISGGAGNDDIVAGEGDDLLDGGEGDDAIRGNDGNDTYIYNVGDGTDNILDSAGSNDVLQLEALTQDDVELSRQANHLLVSIISTGAFVIVNDFFSSDSIESIKFGDNTSWNRTEILKNVEQVIGSAVDDNLIGTDGDNLIFGQDGHDVLEGGLGDDRLEGDNGNDTYLINSGDGRDVIFDTAGVSDKLIFGAGITASNIIFSQANSNLIISFTDNAGSDITIRDWFAAGDSIETFEFANGTVWNEQTIRSRVTPLALTADELLAGKNSERKIDVVELLGNDTIPNSNQQSIDAVGNATNGSVTFNQQNNQVIFTPDADFTGDASFIYSINDGSGGSVSETVTLKVVENNEPELSSPITLSSADGSSITITESQLLAQYIDRDGDPLSIRNLSVEQGGGTLTESGAGTWLYTPATNFSGQVNLSYELFDGKTHIDSFTAIAVSPNVITNPVPVNAAPQAVADTANTREDQPLLITASTLLTNDTDLDGDNLSITSVNNPVNGQVSINASGDVEFLPDADFYGEAGFDYEISDGNGGSATTTVTVNISAENDAPEVVVALPDLDVIEGEVFDFQIPANTFADIDSDPLVYSASLADDLPLPDWLKFDPASGQFTGTPGSADTGSIDIKVTASDPGANAVSEIFRLEIGAVNPQTPPADNDSDSSSDEDRIEALYKQLVDANVISPDLVPSPEYIRDVLINEIQNSNDPRRVFKWLSDFNRITGPFRNNQNSNLPGGSVLSRALVAATGGNDDSISGADQTSIREALAQSDTQAVNNVFNSSAILDQLNNGFTDTAPILADSASVGQLQANNQLDRLVTAIAAFNPSANSDLQLPEDFRERQAPVLAASLNLS